MKFSRSYTLLRTAFSAILSTGLGLKTPHSYGYHFTFRSPVSAVLEQN